MMPRYRVTLSASGEQTVEVEAADAADAADKASARSVGLLVDGGSMDWEIEAIEEVEPEGVTAMTTPANTESLRRGRDRRQKWARQMAVAASDLERVGGYARVVHSLRAEAARWKA
jgi:hypothetical protein